MAIINQASKQLHVKIVYYGPPKSGKTTNLVALRDALETEGHPGKLTSLATSTDRTLFFDYLPDKPILIKGFKVGFQFYAVTGPVCYNSSRQLVLRGVDGLVFVADSRDERMWANTDSFENLQENLRSLKLSLEPTAYVLQYNRRDAPDVAALERMEALLNNRRVKVPSFPAIATNGTKVLETFNRLKRMLLDKFTDGDNAAAFVAS